MRACQFDQPIFIANLQVVSVKAPLQLFSGVRMGQTLSVPPPEASGLSRPTRLDLAMFYFQFISIASLRVLSFKPLLQIFVGVRPCHCRFPNIQTHCQETTYHAKSSHKVTNEPEV